MNSIDEFLKQTDPAKDASAEKETALSTWYAGSAENEKLDLSVKTGVKTAPDTAARVLSAQKKTTLPEDVIQRNLDSIEQQTKTADFDPLKFRTETPVTADWMSESPNNSAVVQDDVPGTQQIEKTVRDYSLGESMWRSLMSGMSSLDASIARLPALTVDTALLPGNLLYKTLGHPELQSRSPDWLMNNPVAKYYDTAAESFKPPDMDQSIIENAMKGNFKQAGRTLAAQFAANAPNQAALIAATLMGGGTPGLVAGGAVQAAGVAKESREKGADPSASTSDALLQGTIESGFESLGTFGILTHWEEALAKSTSKMVSKEIWKDVAKTLVASVAGEANEEFLTQIAQDFSDYMTGVNPEAMKGTFQRAIDAGIIGGASGGAMTAPSAILAGGVHGIQLRQAERARDFYLALGDSAEASKLRERLPEAQQELISRMTKDSPVENVYIPVEAVDTYFQSKDLNPTAAMQDIGALESYAEAKQTGADVKIPLAAWANKVVGTDHYKGLADDIKFSPEALSVNQGKELKAKIEAMDAQQAKEQQPVNPAVESGQKVIADITEQLKTAGFDDQTAKTYATIYSAFGVLGQREGIDPEQLFKQYGVQINRPEVAPEISADTLTQEKKEEPLTPQNSTKIAPAFYSKMQRTIDEKMPTSATVEQVRGLTKDIKEEERKWSGLDEFLKGKEKVSKTEILDFLRANQLEVQEVMKKSKSSYNYVGNEWQTAINRAEAAGDFDEAERINRAWEGVDEESGSTSRMPQFGAYQLPGGKNYRELLLKLPDPSWMYEGRKDAPSARAESKVFRSSHYKEMNILAHIRFNERTDSDGKRVLFIEEVQSDWHQKGRKEGYKGDPASAKKFFGISDEAWNEMSDDRRQNYVLDMEENNGGIPDAPFKKTWHEFALKRMIRYAAENGFDRIAWTTGEQQADRYDLSKQVEDVRVRRREDGTFSVAVTEKEKSGLTVINQAATEQELPELLGKDLATKISQQKVGPLVKYEGVDLKVGGEGMKGFYDQIVPSFMNKFGKRFGVKVGQTTLPSTEKLSNTEINNLSDEILLQNLKAPLGSIRVHSLDITPSLKDAALNEGFSLFQSDKKSILGMFQFSKDKQVNISILKNADLSTFLHETGHFYMEVLADLAERPETSEQTKTDYATILKWLNAESRQKLNVEQKEQFARGFEAYLMEGKAPSSALRVAFSKFRAWLISIYRQLANLNVKLSPQVTGVFDRMLASEEEIAQTRAQQQITPLFADPKAIGMSDKEIISYHKAIEEARTSAEEELSSKLMEDVQREQKSWWKEQRAKMRDEVDAEVSGQKEFVALDVLQGRSESENKFGMKPFKLSREAIVKDFPTFSLKNLPRPYVYTKEGGVHPEAAAEIFGFRSGAELLFNLENSEKKADVIDLLTDQRMKETYGDLINDGRLPLEAIKAVHNEKRSELLHAELQHLASDNFAALKGLVKKITRRIPPIDAVRAQASEIIAQKKVRDISPLLYQRAESRAGQEAVDLLLKGDIEAAFNAKQRELLNHELFRAATSATEAVDKIVDYVNKFERPSVRERMAKAGDYLDQIDAISQRFDFNKYVSLRVMDKRKSLAEWVRQQQDLGFSVELPESVMNEAFTQHYKDTSYEELVGIGDSIKNIEHLARVKNKLLANKKGRDMLAAREEIIASISANFELKSEPMDLNPKFGKRFLTNLKQIAAEHTRLEFLYDFLDGNKGHGAVWEYFFKPIADAEDTENTMRKGNAEALREIFKQYTKQERADWFTKRLYIPDAKTTKIDGNMNKANLIAVALNWGNTYNRDALMQGYGWNEGQVKKMLELLDERDWKTVQALWDHVDSFWAQIAEQEKELNGLVPEKVEPTLVDTGRFGKLKGGYYPIVFDGKQSWRQAALEERSSVQEMFGGNWARAATRHGHTEARNNTGGKPLLLELSGFTNHLSGVIHDLAFRKAIIDVSRLSADPEIRAAMESAAGREMVKQINPWLHGIAGDRAQSYASAMEGLLGRARMGATVVGLGLNFTSAIVQTMGFTLSVKDIGPKYAAKGIREAFAEPFKIGEKYDFITQRSPMMRDRMTNYDREVRDFARRPEFGPESGAWFMMAAYMDLGTSIPTWLGAYRKAMDGNMENILPADEAAAIEYADQVVRTTQAAGSAKDLAAVQRGGEAWKLFTMFYSSLSIQFNQFQKTGQQFVADKNIPKLLGSLALTWFVPAVLEEFLRGRGPDDDDEESILAWLARKEVMYPFASVILARDIANGLERTIESGRKNFDGSPAMAVGEALVGAGLLGYNALTNNEVKRSNIKDAAMTVGYFGQLPMRQVWKTGEYLYDFMTGAESPEGVGEFLWKAAVSGKTRD